PNDRNNNPATHQLRRRRMAFPPCTSMARPPAAGKGSGPTRISPERCPKDGRTIYALDVAAAWSPSERRILESLDAALSRPEVAARLTEIGERVLATLARGPREIEGWGSGALSPCRSTAAPER